MTDTTTTTSPRRATDLAGLIARVEALEASRAQGAPWPHFFFTEDGRIYSGSVVKPLQQPAAPAVDADATLAQQVARTIGRNYADLWESEASDVIRIVARWLRVMGFYDACYVLEQEAQR